MWQNYRSLYRNYLWIPTEGKLEGRHPDMLAHYGWAHWHSAHLPVMGQDQNWPQYTKTKENQKADNYFSFLLLSYTPPSPLIPGNGE